MKTWLHASVVCAMLVSPAAHGQNWDELIDGHGDADSRPSRHAQFLPGPVQRISGSTGMMRGDFIDAFIIRITDPSAFYATTDPRVDAMGFASFDTRLFLFDPYGRPIMANDDTPTPLGANHESTIGDPAFFAGLGNGGLVAPGIPVFEPGYYVLAIGGAASNPLDDRAQSLFTAPAAPRNALFGPAAGAGSFASWTLDDGATTGFYSIALGGVAVPGPASLALLAVAGLITARRSRRRAAIVRTAARC